MTNSNSKKQNIFNNRLLPVWIIGLSIFFVNTACHTQTHKQPAKGASGITPSGLLADSLATRMSKTVMALWKDPVITNRPSFPRWNYEEGVILKGLEGRWLLTGDATYFNYIQHSIDNFVDDSGQIKTYDSASLKLDDINTGKLLLTLYRVTGKAKYWQAAGVLRRQLARQPRVSQGGFWHKKIYPNQMWLDGLYMAEPFYAEFARLHHEDTSFSDVGRQFTLMERQSLDKETGLLFHGWDASKEQKWANKTTGVSENIWGRAMGWYVMAIVDALDYFPTHHPYRDSLIGILNNLSKAIVQYQDKPSHCWWQVMDRAGDKGNYLEASASCMFVYALAKGVRMGYLPKEYGEVAQNGFNGIVKQFIQADPESGQLRLTGNCAVAGLGGKPYRDGTYQYYIEQRPVINDAKGIGAFLLAANEIQALGSQDYGWHKNQQTTVLLDNFYNHETKKSLEGPKEDFHYVWSDRASSGFSFWGDVFRFLGARTETLTTAPTAKNLGTAGIYIIVDPDTGAESPTPNHIQSDHINAIKNWVKGGGVLVLLANDTLNCEFEHFNQLAEAFDLHFDGNSLNRVKGHEFDQGAIQIQGGNPVFKTAKKVYIKELSSIKVKKGARIILKLGDNQVVGAYQPYGRGTVLAIGDPWLYNEYVDGRKLPATFQNYAAMEDLSKWLLKQVK